jgi:uncharacterized protein YrrD
MLRTMKELEDYAIDASDGVIGHVKDVYFDDATWVMRYLVVETGSWLSSRKVLISPVSIGEPDHERKLLPVSISREQVRNSPDIDTEKPVSRQHEIGYLGYYGYPSYWGGAGYWGAEAFPNLSLSLAGAMLPEPRHPDPDSDDSLARNVAHLGESDDPHLRSCKAIAGYHIEATDGDIGHVQGILFDEATWALRYLIVDTSNWWAGHQVLIAPQWIEEVRWLDSTVSIALTRKQVQNAPPYDPDLRLGRDAEATMYEHYGRAGYWNSAVAGELAASRHSRVL